MNSDDRFGDAQKLMAYGFSVLKPVEPAENVYILRQAPAGQTLSDIKEKQAQAAELASQQKQKPLRLPLPRLRPKRLSKQLQR